MKFRIIEYGLGWIVQVQRRKWYGRKYWTGYVMTSGMNIPWVHESYDFAEMNLLNQIKHETIVNSTFKD